MLDEPPKMDHYINWQATEEKFTPTSLRMTNLGDLETDLDPLYGIPMNNLGPIGHYTSSAVSGYTLLNSLSSLSINSNLSLFLGE